MNPFNKISTQEKIDLARNLSLLVKSGTPIDRSFGILAGQSGPVLKKILTEGKKKIERGTPISEIFEGNPNFDRIFVNFIRAGEESGSLVENFDFLVNWLEGKNNLERGMSSATLYPKIIVVFAVLLGLGLSVFILPQIIPVFGALDVELPITTRALLFVSNLITENTLIVFSGLIGIFIIGKLLLKLNLIKRIVHKMLIRIPVVGPLLIDYQLAIITYLAAILLRSGFTINKTLGSVGGSITNSEYRDAIDEVTIRAEKGSSLFQSFKNFPMLFPALFINIVSVGEETGSLADSFDYLSKFYFERVKEKTTRLPVVIEPILLIAIGLFVAFIASAIILPIYEVTRGF